MQAVTALILILSLFSSEVWSDPQTDFQRDSGFYVQVDAGSSNLDISSPFTVDGTAVDGTALAIGYKLGYEWVNGVRLEVGEINHDDYLFGVIDGIFGFDDYSLKERLISVAYAVEFDWGRLIPRLSYSKYRFESLEGAFFMTNVFSGGSREQRILRDEDYSVSLGIEKDFDRDFAMSLNVTHLDAAFGSLDSAWIGLLFRF